MADDKRVDAKTLDGQLDAARKRSSRERQQMARLQAELAFQDSQRAAGHYRPDTPPIVPLRAPARSSELRRVWPAATTS